MLPDSNSSSPPPPDDRKRPARNPEKATDDESVDLGHLETAGQGASASMSFSGSGSSSGIRGGGSSSAIRSWDELVKGTAPEPNPTPGPDAENVSFATPGMPDPIDPASDKDLLKQVLADEPPPSDIVFKDPSQGEVPALPADARPKSDPGIVLGGSFDDVPLAEPASASGRHRGPGSGPFELPPELAATRPGDSASAIPRAVPAEPGDSSILGHNPPSGPGQSGVVSDLFGSSSQVDLLRPGEAPDGSGDSLQHTDEVDRPPLVGPASGDSGTALLGETPAGGVESSAVDLGSEPSVDMPFGQSSVGGASVVQSGRRAGDGDPDSGTVDLLRSSSDEFDLGLDQPTTSPSWAAAREDLPPTVPLVPAGRAKWVGWAGGGTAWLLAGVAVCAGLWYAGAIPDKSIGRPVERRADDPALAGLRARADAADKEVERLRAEHDALAKKSAAADKQARKATDDLNKVTGQLKQAGLDAAALADVAQRLARADAAAAEAKQARERADALAEQVKKAEAAQGGVKGSVDQLRTAREAAEARARAADAELARAREQAAKAGSEAQAAKDALAKAEAARKQAAGVVAAVAQRLRAPANSAADVLAALDRALARPAGEPATTTTTTTAAAPPPAPSGPPAVPAEPVRTPEQARVAAFTGYAALKSNDAAGAEREFGRLAASADATAIDWYYLGLARYRQGRWPEAEQAFRRGWELERDSHPPPSQVDQAFERLSRADRAVINRYRQ